jgi:hypothetical protein
LSNEGLISSVGKNREATCRSCSIHEGIHLCKIKKPRLVFKDMDYKQKWTICIQNTDLVELEVGKRMCLKFEQGQMSEMLA